MGACALTTEVGTGAKLPPGTRVVLTTSEYDFVRLFRFLEAAPTGITPNLDGHPVSGTATRHTTARRANGGIRAPCVPTCRKTRPGEGPCCSRLTCIFTRGTGLATIWLSIARTTPVMPGLYGRRPLFEDRPTSVLIKPAQLYARPAVTPGAGLYRLHCRAPRPLFGGLSMFPPGTSRRATIYRSGCSARDASFTRPFPKYNHNTGHRTSPRRVKIWKRPGSAGSDDRCSS